MNTLKWSGNAVFLPSEQYGSRRFCHLNMMAQDAGTTVFSRAVGDSSNSLSRHIQFAFEPYDQALAGFASAIVRDQYDEGFETAVPSFLNMMASTIVAEERFVYELCVGRSVDSQQIEGFAFRPVLVPGGRVVRLGKWVAQVLPVRVSKRVGSGRLRMLEPSSTFVFAEPRNWHRRLRVARRVSRMYDQLEGVERSRFLEASDKSGLPSNYMDGHKSRLRMLAKAVAPLGWNRGGTFRDFITDYQVLEWAIRWAEFCTDLGNTIIGELQRAVSRIAALIGSQSRLVVRELGNRTRGRGLRERLRKGQVSMSEVLDSVV